MGTELLIIVFGVPMALLLVYMIARIVSAAVLQSIQEWQERKKK